MSVLIVYEFDPRSTRTYIVILDAQYKHLRE